MPEAGPRLRRAEASDEAFLFGLYCSTRRSELERVPWSNEQKQAFLAFQSSAQERHYRTAYPALERLLIERNGMLIGRLYRCENALEHRLLDITLLPRYQGEGLGTWLIGAEINRAEAEGRVLRLHVESTNPARRLYARMGFVLTEDQGVYLALERLPAALQTRSEETD